MKKSSLTYFTTRADAGLGVVTVCMGVTESYAGLIVCRFFLGLFEAGFFPGECLRCYMIGNIANTGQDACT